MVGTWEWGVAMRGKWRENKEAKMVSHSRWEPKISENNRRKQGEKSKWS